MAFKNKQKTSLQLVLSFLVLVGIYGFYSSKSDMAENIILPQKMVYNIVPGSAQIVSADILKQNSEREKIGIPPVSASWQQAQVSLDIKNKNLVVLLDNKDKISIARIINHAIPAATYLEEYSVLRGHITGPAAFWRKVNDRFSLFQSSHYNKSVLSGPTVYFNRLGNEIARLEFKNGQPHDGTLVERNPDGSIRQTTKYKNGMKHGAMEIFNDGKITRRHNFQNGKQEGLQQFFDKGQLLNEKILQNNVTRLLRNYDENANIIVSYYYDKRGRADGPHFRYNANGTLIVDKCFQRGAKHGLFWTMGKKKQWYWKNEHLGADTQGKEAFEAKFRLNRHTVYCPFSNKDYEKFYTPDSRYSPPIDTNQTGKPAMADKNRVEN